MTDREKIRAEVIRLISELGDQRDVLLEELLEFIDSLPEEPISEDLEEKVIPTKLDVFNMGKKLSFDVNTPQFLKEACEYVNGGMYAVCWNVFKNLIAQVAERATELNDPVLNTLMIRLNLYEIPNYERYKFIKRMEELYDASIKDKVKNANDA